MEDLNPFPTVLFWWFFYGFPASYIQSFLVTLTNKILQYIVYQYRADAPLF